MFINSSIGLTWCNHLTKQSDIADKCCSVSLKITASCVDIQNPLRRKCMPIIENSEEYVADAVESWSGSGDQTDKIVTPSSWKRQISHHV